MNDDPKGSPPEFVLQLDGITKSYNRGAPNAVAVLRGASLQLRAGEIVALVAPSGAGKSTLLHIAGLLDQPDSGRVVLMGQDMAGQTEARRTHARCDQLGFVYQFHHLLPEFSALENIMLPQWANGTARPVALARAKALLVQVGLSARADHRTGAMSGGEAQRVSLCRALANRPALLLADEPTGNLDPETSERVFTALIDTVRATGLAALIATHNMALAARMDRRVTLVSWQLVEDGSDAGVAE